MTASIYDNFAEFREAKRDNRDLGTRSSACLPAIWLQTTKRQSTAFHTQVQATGVHKVPKCRD